MPPTKWDDRLRRAAETRGTVTILCGEGERDLVAAAAREVGRGLGLEPQIDRAPAGGVRVGYRPQGGEGRPPVT